MNPFLLMKIPFFQIEQMFLIFFHFLSFQKYFYFLSPIYYYHNLLHLYYILFLRLIVKCFVNTKSALDKSQTHDYSMGTIQDSKAVTKKACDIPDLQRAVSAEIRCYGNRKWLSLPSRYPQREFPSSRYPLHRVKAEELSDFVKWRS